MADEKEKPGEPAEDEMAIKLPITIKLGTPIYDGTGEIKEFVIKREPLGADWSGLNINNLTMLDFQQIASRLTGHPLPIIKKADTKATFKLAEVISSFL